MKHQTKGLLAVPPSGGDSGQETTDPTVYLAEMASSIPPVANTVD